MSHVPSSAFRNTKPTLLQLHRDYQFYRERLLKITTNPIRYTYMAQEARRHYVLTFKFKISTYLQNPSHFQSSFTSPSPARSFRSSLNFANSAFASAVAGSVFRRSARSSTLFMLPIVASNAARLHAGSTSSPSSIAHTLFLGFLSRSYSK